MKVEPIRPTQEDREEFEPVTDSPLDSGIRDYVLALRSGGVETFESCEGGEGHCFPRPTVRFHGSMTAGFHAFNVAMERGLPVSEIRLAYHADGAMLVGPHWEMVFSRKAQSLAATFLV